MITLCFKIANTPTPPKNKQEIFLWRIMLVKNICLLYKNAPTRCRGHCSSRLSKKGKSLKSIKKKNCTERLWWRETRDTAEAYYTDRDFFISLRQIYLSWGYSFSISVFRKGYSTVPLTTPPTQLGRALWGALQPSFLPLSLTLIITTTHKPTSLTLPQRWGSCLGPAAHLSNPRPL